MTKQEIKLEIASDLEGEYVNFAMVTHSPAEFVIDFVRILHGQSPSKVRCRVILVPMHIKALRDALSDNIEKFEKKFGEVKVFKSDESFEGVITNKKDTDQPN